jgi:hypothetical protein
VTRADISTNPEDGVKSAHFSTKEVSPCAGGGQFACSEIPVAEVDLAGRRIDRPEDPHDTRVRVFSETRVDVEEPVPAFSPTTLHLDVPDAAGGFKNEVVTATVHFGPHHLDPPILYEPAVLKHIG